MRNFNKEMNNATFAIEQSGLRFEQYVFPVIKHHFGLKSEYISIESLQNDETLSKQLKLMFKNLDNMSGIDGVVMNANVGMRTVGVRVQVIEKAWNSFSVRFERSSGLKTEYEKRVMSIMNGYLYPMLTIQAYVNRRHELLSCGICNTLDMYSYFLNDLPTDENVNPSDGNKFKILYWSKFQQYGYGMYIYPENQNNESYIQSTIANKKQALTFQTTLFTGLERVWY